MLMLKNKTALVTGTSRGIGWAICQKFASEGAKVYAGVRSLTKNVNSENIKYIELDVCNIQTIRDCVKKIKDEEGKLDILVNNAGITIPARLEMVSNVTKTAIRLLKKSDAPCIINMSSIMAQESDIGQTVYAGTKAAVESMTRTWAKEYPGIRVNAVAPGNVNTDMFNIIGEDALKQEITKIGLRRIAEPDEIANVVLFLASDLASYVTGEVLKVNGGLVL